MLLLGGTGMHALCAALSRLGVPRVFTAQLLFLHRYLFVLAEEALRMSTAHRLRAAPGRRLALSTYASLAGQLLLRAFDRAARVHQSMRARGFDGTLQLDARRAGSTPTRASSACGAATSRWCARSTCRRPWAG